MVVGGVVDYGDYCGVFMMQLGCKCMGYGG